MNENTDGLLITPKMVEEALANPNWSKVDIPDLYAAESLPVIFEEDEQSSEEEENNNA